MNQYLLTPLQLDADATTHLSANDDNMILVVYEVYRIVQKLFLLADKVDPRQGSLHPSRIH